MSHIVCCLSATGEVSSAPTSWTPISKPADVALVVTVCQPDQPSSSVKFKLALHSKSPASIFYEHQRRRGEFEDGPSQLPVSTWRQKNGHLRPGQEYRRLLEDGKIFVFGSVVQKSTKGKALFQDTTHVYLIVSRLPNFFSEQTCS
jgi:hypothetical protein